MNYSCRFVFLSVLAMLPVSLFAQQAPRPVTIDDIFQIREVHDPQLSPDAKWLAYTVGTGQLKDDSNKQRIWMLSIPNSGTAATHPIALTSEDASSTHPRWSPDGKFIAFLSARNEGKEQVWLLNRLGGEAEKLTETAQDVDDFFWSPDGRRMALVLRDPSPEELEEAKDKDKDKEKGDDSAEKGKKKKTERP